MEKIELHAHLSGCMRFNTLQQLIKRQFGQDQEINFQSCTTLDQCFILFAKINSLNLSLEDVKRITQEVFEDFHKDDVKYLEIRATPKKGQDFDQLQYLQAISQIITNFPMEIKLIVAVDRAKSIDDAIKTYNIIKNNKIPHIVGVDLCGHPGKGLFSDFKPILQKFRDLGLKITIHTGELQSQIEENNEILEFKPDRIGHFIYFTKHQLQKVKELKIPIEVCFSSNLFTTSMKPIEHPIKIFIENDIPVIICTDDTLCFNTTISKEIQLIQNTFGYKNEEIKKIQENAYNYRFKLE